MMEGRRAVRLSEVETNVKSDVCVMGVVDNREVGFELSKYSIGEPEIPSSIILVTLMRPGSAIISRLS
jgi:hypothetical protein